jgi:L-alanine-DL-glutamate epimerase-like enolase superfamily enzyme
VATLKVNKLGGISPALKIVGMAEAADVPCMMGCMAENAISIAASLHVALARRNVKYIDLDTFMFLKHQPAEGVKVKKGMMQPRHAPGLGVDVDKKIFKK